MVLLFYGPLRLNHCTCFGVNTNQQRWDVVSSCANKLPEFQILQIGIPIFWLSRHRNFKKKLDRNLRNWKRNQNSAYDGGPRNPNQKSEFPTKCRMYKENKMAQRLFWFELCCVEILVWFELCCVELPLWYLLSSSLGKKSVASSDMSCRWQR